MTSTASTFKTIEYYVHHLSTVVSSQQRRCLRWRLRTSISRVEVILRIPLSGVSLSHTPPPPSRSYARADSFYSDASYMLFLAEFVVFSIDYTCRSAANSLGVAARWLLARETKLDVSKAMGYLHSRSPPVLHRDLKSLNLLIAKEDGPVKLCDFGLVR